MKLIANSLSVARVAPTQMAGEAGPNKRPCSTEIKKLRLYLVRFEEKRVPSCQNVLDALGVLPGFHHMMDACTPRHSGMRNCTVHRLSCQQLGNLP